MPPHDCHRYDFQDCPQSPAIQSLCRAWPYVSSFEVVGTSEKGIDDATRSAIDRAHQTIRGLAWCEVSRINGHIKEGRVTHFQVTLKVGFTLEEPQNASAG